MVRNYSKAEDKMAEKMLKENLIGILLASVMLTSCVGVGRGQSASARDGFAWNQASQPLKIGYVMGFTDAASWAWSNVDGAEHVLKSLSPKDRQVLAGGKEVWDYENIKYAQLVEGMDDFYVDNLNKAIKWDRALSYVRDCIHGEPKDYLEAELNFERKRATLDSTGK
jgi:hypothetical protein